MDTDSLVYDIKTGDFYEDITDNVPARFDTSGYCSNRPLPVGLNKKVIGLMKDELGGKIMTEFVALRPKLYSYKKLDGSEDKKCKGIKKFVVKKTLRDGPLLFYRGGYHFWDLQTIFLKSNAFQTIFFITFCNGNNFLQPFFKNVTGFFIDLI